MSKRFLWLPTGRLLDLAFIPLSLMRRANTLEKTLMLGKTESKRGRRRQRMRWLGSITDSMDKNLSKLWETVEVRGAWRAAVYGVKMNQT